MPDGQLSMLDKHSHILAIVTLIYVSDHPISLKTIMHQASCLLSKQETIQLVDFLADLEYVKARAIDNPIRYRHRYSFGPFPPILLRLMSNEGATFCNT